MPVRICWRRASRLALAAYVRHLVNQNELLGHRLLTLHNLRFLIRLTDGAREAILGGTFTSYKRDALERLRP